MFHPVHTVHNYVDVFYLYSYDVKNTLILAGGTVGLTLVFGYPFAFLLTRKIQRIKDLLNLAMIIPLFGELYIAYGLWFLFMPGGPLSFIFQALHISVFAVLYTKIAAIIGMSIAAFPFMVLNLSTSIAQLNPIYEERARCLGANGVTSFWQIVFPLTLPGILSGSMMVFGWSFWAFVIPVMLGGKTGGRVVAQKIYRLGQIDHNFGAAAALAVLLLVIGGIVSYVSIKYSKGVVTE